MQLQTLLYKTKKISILDDCSEFIENSNGLPVYKNLPDSYKDIQKVKVRYKKQTDSVSLTFNEAFKNELPQLSQRAVFANGSSSFNPVNCLDTFYILPTNGYSFLYSKEVQNSSENYKAVIDSVLETFGGDVNKTSSIVAEVIRYTYNNTNLEEGIEQGSEIIFLDIPYYYAIHSSTISYEDLLTSA